jgi:hypothetical protein
MQLVFTKGFGKTDRMEVIRAGSPVEVVDCPKQGIIPHDMIHCAVEKTLHKRGFIGRVLDGEAAAFRMEQESESDAVERLVEVFQADGWSGWGSPPEDMLELYRVTCSARRCAPLAVARGDVEAVRERILELTSQWQSIRAGEALTLQF